MVERFRCCLLWREIWELVCGERKEEGGGRV